VAFCNEKGVTVEELLSWRDLALSGIEVADSVGGQFKIDQVWALQNRPPQRGEI
jgi:hypothetical protein